MERSTRLPDLSQAPRPCGVAKTSGDRDACGRVFGAQIVVLYLFWSVCRSTTSARRMLKPRISAWPIRPSHEGYNGSPQQPDRAASSEELYRARRYHRLSPKFLKDCMYVAVDGCRKEQRPRRGLL